MYFFRNFPINLSPRKTNISPLKNDGCRTICSFWDSLRFSEENSRSNFPGVLLCIGLGWCHIHDDPPEWKFSGRIFHARIWPPRFGLQPYLRRCRPPTPPPPKAPKGGIQPESPAAERVSQSLVVLKQGNFRLQQSRDHATTRSCCCTTSL